MACPYFFGKLPVARDLLKSRAIKGDSRLRCSFINESHFKSVVSITRCRPNKT